MKFKKLLSIFTAVCMLAAVIPSTAFAAETNVVDSDDTEQEQQDEEQEEEDVYKRQALRTEPPQWLLPRHMRQRQILSPAHQQAMRHHLLPAMPLPQALKHIFSFPREHLRARLHSL